MLDLLLRVFGCGFASTTIRPGSNGREWSGRATANDAAAFPRGGCGGGIWCVALLNTRRRGLMHLFGVQLPAFLARGGVSGFWCAVESVRWGLGFRFFARLGVAAPLLGRPARRFARTGLVTT